MSTRKLLVTIIIGAAILLVSTIFAPPAFATGTPLDTLAAGTYTTKGPSNLKGRQFTLSPWADEILMKSSLIWQNDGEPSTYIDFTIVLKKTAPGVFSGQTNVNTAIHGVPCSGPLTYEIRAFSDGLYAQPQVPRFYASWDEVSPPILPPRIEPAGEASDFNDYCEVTGFVSDPDPLAYVMTLPATTPSTGTL